MNKLGRTTPMASHGDKCDKVDTVRLAGRRRGIVAYVRIVEIAPNSHGMDGKANLRGRSAYVIACRAMSEDALAYALCHELGHFGPETDDLYTNEVNAWERADSIWFDCFGTVAASMPGLRRIRRDALHSYRKVMT